MKNKLLIILLIAVSALACALALTACNTDDGKDAHVHNYSKEVFEPTCTERGYTLYTCDCGDSYTGDYVDELGHKFEDYVFNDDATCTKDGTETAVCSREGCEEIDTVTVENSHIGHDFAEYVPNGDATCTKNGTETANCTRCDATATRQIKDSMLEHNYVDYVCSECGAEDPNAPFTLGLKYTPNGDGGYTVYKGSATDSNIIIPSIYNGVNVTAIGEAAFMNCKNLESISIPNTVTFIDYGAFANCINLKSVTLPENLTSIGNVAFMGCDSLKSINIPASVTSIGDISLSCCENLESITVASGNSVYHSDGNCLIETAGKTLIAGCKNSVIPSDGSVTAIGEDAFFGCSGLTNITFPSGLTSIGNSAFYGCYEFTRIEIPASVTYIGTDAFRSCKNLESITVASGNSVYHSDGNCLIETAGKTLIAGCKNSVIPTNGSVAAIGEEAFYGCTYLTSINIPESVTSIGNYAFYGCNSLTNITFPNGLTSIGNYAFYYCSSLTNITFPNGLTSIGNGAFSLCYEFTRIEIPASVTHIGNGAFQGCKNLESIAVASGNSVYHSNGNCLIETAGKTLIAGCKNSVIPSDGSVTAIGESAFYGCTGLTSINIPDGVTIIGLYAFCGCENLISITLSDGVTSIRNLAFCNCKSLASITIPKSVTYIGPAMFSGCTALTDVYYEGSEDDWANIEIGVNNEALENVTINYNS